MACMPSNLLVLQPHTQNIEKTSQTRYKARRLYVGISFFSDDLNSIVWMQTAGPCRSS